ncbi:SDR family NAD(P)-dependent oxidoreductase [Gordonia sp. LSe1-13]|uniref:SDR family NAD(P)-dependent oxidoreductase n=1 Tax=Gordonia sesuvii TaxID=3116777 RepID=A0ABU7MFG5_9ACTN|nr:SDR family NAD(P)-dependent oxidoreductase [Gordonia sp. LSe1-13]
MTTATLPFHAHSTPSDVLAGVDLTGRRMIVTGGGAGIGAEITRSLTRAGADVTIAVRNPERVSHDLTTDDLASHIHVEHIDLADLESVRSFAGRWQGPVDAVVCNAGVMAIPDLQRTATGWEYQLAVNFLGHFALALQLQPALAAAHGRLVVVSSGAHRDVPFDFDDPQFHDRPYDRWVAYGQSKTADILLATEAARRWVDRGITANAVNPGWVMTDLQRHLDDETMRAMGAIDDDGNVIPQPYSKTLEEAAAPSVLLAASPLAASLSGVYLEDNQPAAVTASGPAGVAPHAVADAAAQRLWDLAEAAVRM